MKKGIKPSITIPSVTVTSQIFFLNEGKILNIKKKEIGITQKCACVWKGASFSIVHNIIITPKLTQNSILSKALILARHTKINGY